MASILRLQCPYCRQGFVLKHVGRSSGLATCLCSNYPIVADVFYLKKDRLGQEAVKFLKMGDTKMALNVLLNLRRTHFLIVNFLLSTSIYKKNLFDILGFSAVIKILSLFSYDRNWVQYLLKRKKIPSYFLSLLAVNLFRKGRLVADLGCGVGYLIKALSDRFSPENVIGVDNSFFNLFLCRNFFANPATLLVCSDLDDGLPFNQNALGGILLTDSFHYIEDKSSFLKEINRVTNSSSQCAIIHTLNMAKLRNIRGSDPTALGALLNSSGFNQVSTYSNETLWYLINSNRRVSLQRSDSENTLKRCYASCAFAAKRALPKSIGLTTSQLRSLKNTKLYFGAEPELLDELAVRKILNRHERVFFISPHFDDAVLSCANLIDRITSQGKSVTILTAFTQVSPPPYSPQAKRFLKACGYYDAEGLFKDREKEDEKATKFLGANFVHLDYIDAAWRRGSDYSFAYASEDAQFSGIVSEEDSELVRSLSAQLKRIIKREKPLLFTPLGVGGHADHVLVREAVKNLKLSTIFWEDFPYNVQEASIKKFFKSNVGFGELFQLNKAGSQKKEAIRIYKSQMKVLFPKGELPEVPERFYNSIQENSGLSARR